MGRDKNFGKTKGKRQFLSIFGVKKEHFDLLNDTFQTLYRKKCKEKYKKRKVLYKNYGIIPRLRYIKGITLTFYLQVVLYYLRHYPTYEVLGWKIGAFSQRAEQIVAEWYPLLLMSLSKIGVAPPEKIEDIEKFVEYWNKTAKDLLVDVTERKINRPSENQKDYYSGKKKCHSIKNTIVCLRCLLIVFLGQTHSGKNHDFGMFKKDCLGFVESKGYRFYVDLGYKGIKKFFNNLHEVFIPHKKPRKSKNNPNPCLDDKQKSYNKSVSKERIYVEHSIGRVKIFKIVSHKFRGRKEGWNHTTMKISTALHNFKIIFN